MSNKFRRSDENSEFLKVSDCLKTVGDGGACFIKPNGDIVEISQADLSPETIITTAEDFALELDADRLVIPLKESTLG